MIQGNFSSSLRTCQGFPIPQATPEATGEPGEARAGLDHPWDTGTPSQSCLNSPKSRSGTSPRVCGGCGIRDCQDRQDYWDQRLLASGIGGIVRIIGIRGCWHEGLVGLSGLLGSEAAGIRDCRDHQDCWDQRLLASGIGGIRDCRDRQDYWDQRLLASGIGGIKDCHDPISAGISDCQDKDLLGSHSCWDAG
ncbi:hypothetical protein DUI87_13369 [Hirundo rustica rustica]|uniref:Uncharacterized protein n=1 Tax=Hirundo rustica rustica TaxID=333673 RepID=A0A3M0KH41_HIRRU|nr:hypothetical protein DUI87_13369 [Hirundo rustica rustica]